MNGESRKKRDIEASELDKKLECVRFLASIVIVYFGCGLNLNPTKIAITRLTLVMSCGDLLSVHCSNCGICCEETMMELSNEDIERLEEKGCRLKEFAVIDDGVTRLRNVDGYCCFYNRTDKKCEIYEKRPMGCYLYPVVYLANKGAIVDELCPMGQTISKQELRIKGKTLDKLLKKIENESAH